MTNEWIPIGKEFPTEKGQYLVTARNEDDTERQIMFLDFYPSGLEEGGLVWGGNWNSNEKRFVCAWMPLPEPYQGGTE